MVDRKLNPCSSLQEEALAKHIRVRATSPSQCEAGDLARLHPLKLVLRPWEGKDTPFVSVDLQGNPAKRKSMGLGWEVKCPIQNSSNCCKRRMDFCGVVVLSSIYGGLAKHAWEGKSAKTTANRGEQNN